MHTLSAQSNVIAGPLTASGPEAIAAPFKPDLAESGGNNGQYSYTYPFSVVPGPDGFAPQLQLAYSSQSTNGRYDNQAPAGDEGEGFSLSLGSITSATYPSTSTGGAATWYSINGVDGVSDRLIPIPGQSGYYETEHISHLRIDYTGSCWRVWDRDGTYYELGCTADSEQTTSAGAYEWDVNKILAPYNSTSQVKTMFVTYLQDSPNSGVIRDAGIKQIQYGFATSTSATSLSLVSGTIDFHYHMPSVPSGQSAFATAYGTNYNCSSTPPLSTTVRCDDPVSFYDSTDSTTYYPPTVMSTMSLDSITSYVGADSANQPAYKYAFAYQDTPFTQATGELTNMPQAWAGEHLLTQITPTVYVSGTAHTRPSVVFGYTGTSYDAYVDPSEMVDSNGGCGCEVPYSPYTLWQYLNFYEDLATGEGARISYASAAGNMAGTPYTTDSQGNVTDDRFDPLYCVNQANNSDPTKQCTKSTGEDD
ncbi:MAG TPA: hypothetical protein VKX46_10620, partial [Ktedonobacteraceae bacterium]|nr:hypothetical protein [Ktedonobacteraceae bacterium]